MRLVAGEHPGLGDGLEPAVAARTVGVRRQVLGPREDPGERLVVGHDRADVDVVADVTVEQVEQALDVRSAGGHHEPGDVEHGVPVATVERGAQLADVGAVGDQPLDVVGQVGRRPATVEHGDLVTGFAAAPPRCACRRTPSRPRTSVFMPRLCTPRQESVRSPPCESSDMDLDGKVAFITGGTRGIGRGIAEAFLANGASVMLNGRSAEKGQQALDRDGRRRPGRLRRRERDGPGRGRGRLSTPPSSASVRSTSSSTTPAARPASAWCTSWPTRRGREGVTGS